MYLCGGDEIEKKLPANNKGTKLQYFDRLKRYVQNRGKRQLCPFNIPGSMTVAEHLTNSYNENWMDFMEILEQTKVRRKVSKGRKGKI